MPTIYDIVGDGFFTPLASKNKKIYLDTILYLHILINELFDDGENEKGKIIESLAAFLDDRVAIKLFDDNSDEEVENTNDNLSKARFIINKLEAYGWLTEESIGDGKRAMDFSSSSYSFISVIEEIINNRKASYTGFVRSIRDLVFRFDYSTVDDLDMLDKYLHDFIVSLRELRSSIQRFYKNITKNKDVIDLVALLEEFTGEYKNTFFDSAYLRLKVIDNVDVEIPRIKEQVNKIFDDFLGVEKLINAKMEDKDCSDYSDANQYVNETRKRISSALNTIPSLIQMIDSKNTKYVTRTVSVIIHLINRGEDIEGILNRLINYAKDDEIDENFINFLDIKHYSFDLLSRPRKVSTKPEPEILPLDIDISDDIKEHALEILQEDMKYNINSTNSFVQVFLGDKKERLMSDLDLSTKYEFIMMICIIMFSKLPAASYDIELLNSRITKNGISFNDFTVKKREVI